MKYSEKATAGGAGKAITKSLGKVGQSALLRRLLTQSVAIGAGKTGTRKTAQ
jgi:hypothetical protein